MVEETILRSFYIEFLQRFFLLLSMENNLFSKTLFWDVYVLQMDLQKSKFYIIERIVTRGNYKDWKTMLSAYSKQEIKECII